MDGCIHALVGKPIWRPRHKWEDNIKMDINRIGLEDVDWIDLSQKREKQQAVLNTAMNPRIP
jgi:hypothetical protein